MKPSEFIEAETTDPDFTKCPRCGRVAVLSMRVLFSPLVVFKRCLKCKKQWEEDRAEG